MYNPPIQHSKRSPQKGQVYAIIPSSWQQVLTQRGRQAHLAVSGLTVRLPVWPWQQVCVKPVQKWGVRASWIFIMTSPVYWLQCGGHTQVRLFGPPESTVNWSGRRREEGGSELIAHIRVIPSSLRHVICGTQSHGLTLYCHLPWYKYLRTNHIGKQRKQIVWPRVWLSRKSVPRIVSGHRWRHSQALMNIHVEITPL